MLSPLLLRPDMPSELPEFLADRQARRDEPAVWPGYRSEAFAEDLLGDVAPPVTGRAWRPMVALLVAAPLAAALLGTMLAWLGRSA